MSIRIVASTEPRGEQERRRLRRLVVDLLQRTGSAGRSASGMTLALAVEYCEENRLPYRIDAHPPQGYYLTLLGATAVTDWRPANCRFRLAEEGKPYPRSACTACGKNIMTGLGRSCSVTERPYGEIMDELDHAAKLEQEKPTVPGDLRCPRCGFLRCDDATERQ